MLLHNGHNLIWLEMGTGFGQPVTRGLAGATRYLGHTQRGVCVCGRLEGQLNIQGMEPRRGASREKSEPSIPRKHIALLGLGGTPRQKGVRRQSGNGKRKAKD